MQISSFMYFLAVVDTGSVRQAATNLHVSASAISRQIKNLEYSFKATLFERRISGMVLTEEGRILEQHMRRTMREMELAQAEVNDIKGLMSGNISFASIEGVVSAWLLPAMTSFRKTHPSISFDGRISASDHVYQAVAADEVDFGIAMQDKPRLEIEIVAKFETGFKVVMSPKHVLANRTSISLEELVPHSLAMLNSRFHTRQIIDTVAIKKELSLSIIFELDHIKMLKSFVLATDSMTILPDYAVTEEASNGTMSILDIDDEDLPKSITVLCIKKGRRITKAADKFISLMRQVNDKN